MNKKRVCTTTIYGLAALSDGEIRYIGQTLTKLNHRLKGHIWAAKNNKKTPVACWIKKCISANDEIIILLLQENALYDAEEMLWISWFKDNGISLLNVTDGGCGFTGYKPTKEHKKSISKSLSGRSLSKEHVENLSKALKGKKPSEKTINAVKKSLTGKAWSKNRRIALENVSKSIRSEKGLKAIMSVDPIKRIENARNAAIIGWEKRRESGLHRGVHCNGAKLDDDKVREIREKLSRGISHNKISKHYGVSRKTISKIANGKTWTHVV